MDNGKTILVTGGAGFIGSHLCELLLSQNNQVICLDNLFTGDKHNIEHLLANPLFTFIEHDITIPLPLKQKIGQIYNLACPASPVHYQYDPVKTVQTNTIGVINILNFAKTNQARVLQASTSEVYGDPLEHPQKESYWGNVNPLSPRACYDEGKRVAETLLSDYHRQHKIEIRIARIFNTYGPRMAVNDGRVVSNFIVQALQNQDITIYGDGLQTRSFCFVSDLISGLYLLMNSNYSLPVNLGNPSELTMLEIAKEILAYTQSAAKLTYKPLPQDDPKRRKPDISLAKQKLNWQPKIALKTGLESTISYFKSRLN